jgi:hypothetical protein
MSSSDLRGRHLGWVEAYLRIENPDLPDLWLTGQFHYRSPGFAFIVVHGVDTDILRRRALRELACELLARLGHDVELEARRDVFIIDPERPTSRHEMLHAVSEVRRLV